MEFLTSTADPVPHEPGQQLAGESSQKDTQESGVGGHGQSYFLFLPLECQLQLYPPLSGGHHMILSARRGLSFGAGRRGDELAGQTGYFQHVALSMSSAPCNVHKGICSRDPDRGLTDSAQEAPLAAWCWYQ